MKENDPQSNTKQNPRRSHCGHSQRPWKQEYGSGGLPAKEPGAFPIREQVQQKGRSSESTNPQLPSAWVSVSFAAESWLFSVSSPSCPDRQKESVVCMYPEQITARINWNDPSCSSFNYIYNDFVITHQSTSTTAQHSTYYGSSNTLRLLFTPPGGHSKDYTALFKIHGHAPYLIQKTRSQLK